MGEIFDYYYIGDRSLLEGDIGRSAPVLTAFSKIKNLESEKVGTHLHSHVELFYFESGYGTFEYSGGSIPIHPHDMILINADNLHRQYSDTDAPITYYCFAIDDIAISGKPRNCLSDSPFLLLSLETADNPFYKNINRLITEFRDRNFGWLIKARGIFSEIFVDATRAFGIENKFHLENNSDSDGYADKIKTYIDENYAQPITLNRLTEQTSVSKSHLMRVFKNKFGISPMQYLTLIRIEQAKVLLSMTKLNVTEIADKVGFDNPVYFTEVFSRLLGVSPSVYRKALAIRKVF